MAHDVVFQECFRDLVSLSITVTAVGDSALASFLDTPNAEGWWFLRARLQTHAVPSVCVA